MFDIDAVCAKYQLKPEEREYLSRLVIDESQQEAITHFDQRTAEWHQSRQGRITASRFGAARNHCPYTSQKELLKSLLWGEFKSNAAMEYGVKLEPVAVDKYTGFMRHHFQLEKPEQFQVTHQGLWVSIDHPWVGVSVDGLVWDDSEPDEQRKRGGLEIKCPFGRKLYPFIPSMYYDQIQGSMGFMKLPWWDFVVYTPTQIQIRRVEFNAEYFHQELFPRLESFYMTEYLPRLVAQEKGELLPPAPKAPRLVINCDEEEQSATPDESSTQKPVVQGDAQGFISLSALLR